jgi:hypothetical protein
LKNNPMMERIVFKLTAENDEIWLLQSWEKLRFQVLTAASTKIAFWDIAPCSFVALIVEAVSTSETSVNFCENTRRNNSEGCYLQWNWYTDLNSLSSLGKNNLSKLYLRPAKRDAYSSQVCRKMVLPFGQDIH